MNIVDIAYRYRRFPSQYLFVDTYQHRHRYRYVFVIVDLHIYAGGGGSVVGKYVGVVGSTPSLFFRVLPPTTLPSGAHTPAQAKTTKPACRLEPVSPTLQTIRAHPSVQLTRIFSALASCTMTNNFCQTTTSRCVLLRHLFSVKYYSTQTTHLLQLLHLHATVGRVPSPGWAACAPV